MTIDQDEIGQKNLEAQLEALYEQEFWKVCENKENLYQWIKTFLGIDLPNQTVDDTSTSNPMDFIWDVYNAARTGDPTKTNFVVAAARNSMKCLEKGTLVATPRGPIPIELINIGDTVYDHNGSPIKVIGHWDQGMQPVYELSNGREIIANATEKHIWSTFDIRKPDKFEDKPTSELRRGRNIKRIEINSQFGSIHVPEAYAIGALLGDGCSTECGIRISSQNEIIPTKVAQVLGSPGISKMKGNHTWIIKSPSGIGVKWNASPFYDKWVRNRKAHQKILPYEEVIKWDRKSIVALMAGLIDTDGSIYAHKNSLYIRLGMQATEVIETFQKLFFALWQRTPKITEKTHFCKEREYKNGSLFTAEINHNYTCKRALLELSEFLQVKGKFSQSELDSFKSNNFNPSGFGIDKKFVGIRHCYDLTVDSPESLYCLHNGAVTHNTLGSAIIEFLLMVHFGRDIVHQAAILDQSLACIDYLDKFLSLPIIAKYSKADNKRLKSLKGMPTDKKYKPVGHAKLKVIVATKKSANAQRASCLTEKAKITCVLPQNSRLVEVPIGKIVADFSRGHQRHVLSINPSSGLLEPKPIVAAVKKKQEVYKIKFSNGREIKATEDHKFCTVNGELDSSIAVADLVEGSLLESLEKYDLDSPWIDSFSSEDVLIGSLLGDGCLYQRKLKPDGSRYFGNSMFSMTKTDSVMSYMNWVVDKLSVYSRTHIGPPVRSGYTGLSTNRNIICSQHEFWTDLRKKWYPEDKKIVPRDLELNLEKLAVWLMDNGGPALRTLNTASFTEEDNLFLVEKINELFSADVAELREYFSKAHDKSFFQIHLRVSLIPHEVLARLYSLIHPDYRYKIKASGTRIPVVKSKVSVLEKTFFGKKNVYDIEVEDNHNFFVEGVSSRNCLIFDELDLIDKSILTESAFIADPDRTGKPPIFIFLSSRKSAVGPIQEKIDLANDPNGGVILHKWSSVDFMKTCPPEIHKPELPRVELFLNRDTLLVKEKEELLRLPDNMQKNYDLINAYEGCRKCPAFIVCQAKSPKQQGNSPSLRDISFVAGLARTLGDAEAISAQMLNLKPESGGTVFNKFSRNTHRKSLEEVYEFAFNQKYMDSHGKPAPVSKMKLVDELRAAGWRFHCGVDFGWVDTATAILVAYQKYSDKLIVLHGEASTGLSNQDWLHYVKNNIYDVYGFDLLCPDTADKSAPSFAASLGMPSRNSKPPKIEPGVSWVRTRLWNASKQEPQLVVVDDFSNELLMKSMESWQYLKTAMGFDFSQFADDEWTHALDALRYAIDPFLIQQPATLLAGQRDNSHNSMAPQLINTAEGMKSAIQEHFFREFGIDLREKEDKTTVSSKGGVIFSI